MQVPTEFFSQSTILTLSGASVAVYIVTSAIQHATSFNPQWLALIISIILGMASVALIDSAIFVDYIIGFVNGCLIYCTAVGINSITAKSTKKGMIAKGSGVSVKDSSRRDYRSKWY